MGKRKRKSDGYARRHDFTTGGILGHDSGEYRVNVNERTALGIDTVQACVRVLGDAVGSATVGEFRGTEKLDPPHRLVRRPMASMTRREWLWMVTATLALYYRCPIRLKGRDSDGLPMSLVPYSPNRLVRIGDEVQIDGQERTPISEWRTIRRAIWPTVTDDVGTVLNLSREIFAAAWAQGAYTSDFWENGGAPQIVISTDGPLTNPEADDIRDRYATARRDNPGKPAVVGKGAKITGLGVDLAGTGAGEAGDRLQASIARVLGVPPWIVNVPSAAGSMVYSNTEMAGTDLVRYALTGYLGPIADFLSEQLPGDYIVGRRVELGVAHLTAGTLKERYEAFAIATGNKPWMLPSEVRSELHMPIDMTLDEAGAPAPALESIPAVGGI